METIERVFKALSRNDAASIGIVQDLLASKNLKSNVAYVSSNFGFLAVTIKKLERSDLTLSEQFSLLLDAKRRLDSTNGPCAKEIKAKLNSVIVKNKELTSVQDISSIIDGVSGKVSKYGPAETAAFKYAPLTSVDVERSFSKYKSFLRPNRQSFYFENLREHFIIHCNNNS